MKTPKQQKGIPIASLKFTGNNTWFIVVIFIMFVLLNQSSYSSAQPWPFFYDKSAPEHLESPNFFPISDWIAQFVSFYLLAPLITVNISYQMHVFTSGVHIGRCNWIGNQR